MQNYVDERDGGYYVAGTRIALSSIVHAFQAGESPDEILRSFPMAGPLVKIYGAITFYLEIPKRCRSTWKISTAAGKNWLRGRGNPRRRWRRVCGRRKSTLL